MKALLIVGGILLIASGNMLGIILVLLGIGMD